MKCRDRMWAEQSRKTVPYSLFPALAGKLEIRAVFPGREIRISQFEELPKQRDNEGVPVPCSLFHRRSPTCNHHSCRPGQWHRHFVPTVKAPALLLPCLGRPRNELKDLVAVGEEFGLKAPAPLIRSFNDELRLGNVSNIPPSVHSKDVGASRERLFALHGTEVALAERRRGNGVLDPVLCVFDIALLYVAGNLIIHNSCAREDMPLRVASHRGFVGRAVLGGKLMHCLT